MGIGKLGAASRVLLACCGSDLVYVSQGRSDIEGQITLEQLRAMAHHGDRTFVLTAETAIPIVRPDTPAAVEENEILIPSNDQTKAATDAGTKTSVEDKKKKGLSTLSVIGRKPRRTIVLAENRDFFQIFRYGE